MKRSLQPRWNVSRWALTYPWLTISFWLAIAVAGLLALSSLKYALFPEVTFPVVILQATAPLESVEATESLLTNPLEAPLKDLAQANLYSSTYTGQTVITVAFDAGRTLDQATQEVEQALEKIQLPSTAKLKVLPFNLNESAAVTYAIQAEGQTIEGLRDKVQSQILPLLEKIPGVLRVNLLGDGGFRDKTDRTGVNPPTLTRYNGQDVLAVQVIKQARANTLEVVNRVEQQMAQLQQQWPDLQLIEAETQAHYIQEATTATLEALAGAIVLAILVIFPFLRSWRATLISAIAIPLSLLGTFIVMAALGLNLETLTLLALALVIGIVVDDAIVDVENIARHIEAGLAPKQAALLATEEIGLAVSATTLSIVAVFLPIAFMGGTLGQFFKPFAITVSAAVIFSLLVARTLSPVLAVFWLRPSPQAHPSRFQLPLDRITQAYQSCLAWSLRHCWRVVVFAVLSLVLGLALIPLIPQGFIPTLDRGEFNVVFQSAQPRRLAPTQSNPSPTSTTPNSGAFDWIETLAVSPEAFLLRRSRRIAEQLEPVVLADPNVASVFTVAGGQGNPLKGNLYVQLKADRPQSTAMVQTQLRERLPTIPKVTTSVENILFVQTGDDTPLKLAFTGPDLTQLQALGQTLKSKVEAVPGLLQVKITSDQSSSEAIEHFQGQRAIYLSANLAPGYALGELTQQVTALATPLLPPGVNLELQGDSARLGLVLAEFGVTLLLSLGLMVGILLWLFQRPLEPLVIALSLPLAIVGAMLGLLFTQSDFGMISLIGLIFLLGLLDKNAVLLIDYANQRQAQGLPLDQALLESGRVRLRPIVMTTASTILGMLPLALGWGAGAELRQPMAIAIMGGLTTSSLLSLVVVPVLYSLLQAHWPSSGTQTK
ncbi:efflux RND transporter permease subunit [Synechocystis sp. LKSZ1]|uniref:efflux RND transporter permease subunit n=1 Tax=Synechocystis sp. LKSZ1 TaxID=3144951 RepID=UPI00336BEC0A